MTWLFAQSAAAGRAGQPNALLPQGLTTRAPALRVAVAVHILQAGLMHMLMSVLGPVVVGVGMLVAHMVVLMRGVRMRVSLFAVLVLVRVWRVVGVLLGHGCQLSLKYVVTLAD
jgi:hypothetical protein